ncbi:MAG TPA: DUF294 nucleotidyltransferase-like domain-containing protein [Bacteroidota bacterium]|nr:DUF294 nucleotidyltransferase-like domain-containing protein [Bacteroidota bacterium]
MNAREVPTDLFADPSGADRAVRSLHELFIRSGSRFPLGEFTSALSRGLASAADADLALTGFARFLGASFGGAALLNDLLQYPAYADLLFSIFGHSLYFTDVLVREPALFRWLTSTDAMERPVTEVELRGEIDRLLDTFGSPDRRLDALRRLHRRYLLRVGAQDILGKADLRSATAQLSVLAAAVVSAALRIALDRAGGEPGPFSIIGLGKLGGLELNYSSDIDIVFVYADPPEGEDDGTTHTFFNRVAEQVVRSLSQASGEGYLYRVDTRLRPNAGAGPLALSLGAYQAHYESRGALWERQMLIKARPLAGDAQLGRRFLAMVEPFIYPRTHLEHPAASVARIKARIEAEVAGEQNIKLMAGGIRDIEFIVQTLQLINGGASGALRLPSTLDALDALCAAGLLSKEEHRTLRDAYTLYRTVEHRLQMMLNTQTHTIPPPGRAFDALARRSGFPGAEGLRRALDGALAAVRRVFEQVMAVDGSPGRATIAELLTSPGTDDALVRAAGALGFRDARGAARSLRLLARGGASAGVSAPETGAGEALREVAGPLLEEIRTTRDPDMTLAALALLASSQAVPQIFLRQLGDPPFRKMMLAICAGSPRFARELGSHPLVLEMITSEQDLLLQGAPGSPPDIAGAAAFRARGELLAGIRHVLGFTDFDAMTEELSAVAAAIVSAATAAVAARAAKARPPLAVFALGKFGTGELLFDADIDLLFVSGDAEEAAKSALEEAAARILKGVTVSAAGGSLYEADVRLRPEGKSAPLVPGALAYGRYLAARASLWERQSLTRLRFVAGDASIGRYVSTMVADWVYGTPLAPGWPQEIVRMRRKMESRSRTRGGSFIDLKLGPGGMADIEFVAQMLQLKYGPAREELRRGKTVELLRSAALPCGVPADLRFLASSYAMFRRLEFLLRVALEERGSVLPEGEPLEKLSRLYDGSGGTALESRVAGVMKRVRNEFLSVAGWIEAARSAEVSP